MRSDWGTQTVRELEGAGVLLVQDGNHGEYRPRRHELVPDGTPHIRAADISEDGFIDFAGAQRINNAALARIRKGVGARDDVLLTHKGTVGRLARVPRDAPHFVCSPQTTFWRSLDPDRLDQSFLFAYLRSPEFARQLQGRMHESDMAPYVSLTAQRSLSVVMPPIDEQRRIASILDALDDKIASNRELAGLLEDTAATLFRARFVRFVGAREFEDTELGRVPKGWRVGTLADMAVVIKRSVQPSASPETEFEHFSIPAFDAGRLPLFEPGDAILSSKTLLPEGDCVLISKLNPATRRVWWPRPGGTATPILQSRVSCLAATTRGAEYLSVRHVRERRPVLRAVARPCDRDHR